MRAWRWNGQTLGDHAFSVAQHVLLVEEIATDRNPGWPARWRLAALLHDAPEYVIGDLISPFKTAVGLDYKAFELRLLAAIHRRFGLPEALPGDVTAEIKAADRIAAYCEATCLAGFSREEARRFFGSPSGLSQRLGTELGRLAPCAPAVSPGGLPGALSRRSHPACKPKRARRGRLRRRHKLTSARERGLAVFELPDRRALTEVLADAFGHRALEARQHREHGEPHAAAASERMSTLREPP